MSKRDCYAIDISVHFTVEFKRAYLTVFFIDKHYDSLVVERRIDLSRNHSYIAGAGI